MESFWKIQNKTYSDKKVVTCRQALNRSTVGDGSLILPAYVVKITHPLPGVSWVSRDQELNVEHKYIGFLLYHALILK